MVGGSSGGEAAIIAACGSPFGLGADIGGSIRMPAYFNGIFGHKPSPGLVSNQGQYPTSQDAEVKLLATGPLCRHAEDLMPLLRVMAMPDKKSDIANMQLISDMGVCSFLSFFFLGGGGGFFFFLNFFSFFLVFEIILFGFSFFYYL